MKVPGHDVPIAPSSSVVAEAILWVITAQVHVDVQQQK